MSAELVGMAAAAWLTSAPARAETGDLDSPRADAAHHKVAFENEYVRVVRWVIPAHEKSALHAHPSLVNVLLTDSNLRVTTPDGKTAEVHGKARTVAWRGPTTHVVENVGDAPAEGVLVEPKTPGNPAWAPPPNDSLKLDPTRHKLELENGEVRVERFVIGKGETVPMHDHPTNVVVFLSDAHARSSEPGGKVTETRKKPGDAVYRTALSHSVENLGETFEGFVIALKGAPSKP
ncbi:MAG TPA: hypothetical protein VFE30_10515 [Anaeromyxobacteraceae bacterium]|jgi:quercetin dioxygenase-like cupin family protein|nr:hypothetical protein [Anaeromyxobacteraceae bacterium]